MTVSPLMGSCVHSCNQHNAQPRSFCVETLLYEGVENLFRWRTLCVLLTSVKQSASTCSGIINIYVCVRCQGRNVKLWIDKSHFSVWKSHWSMSVRGWYMFGKWLIIKVYKTLIIKNILSYFLIGWQGLEKLVSIYQGHVSILKKKNSPYGKV